LAKLNERRAQREQEMELREKEMVIVEVALSKPGLGIYTGLVAFAA
jgi:hypothetical protein